ncbi:hypothetical protein B0T16DRAFT_514746 [Cercophora newfieldiana]|uniref:RBR-type E3 ubiquitin transferase n=1 Tax=Cercophora newfieldiana TaxID=92897 RepID=A0AA40CKG6_9PEZI|nr:hypothetical protein B0T16DRAFT_514746 [Cercophora newfieldiana]
MPPTPPRRVRHRASLRIPEGQLAASRPAANQDEKRPTKKITKEICIACNEETYSTEIVQCASCPHKYCRACLESLFRLSLTDTTLFPPKCCGQLIPLETCRILLSPDLIKQFQDKKLEFDTPGRTYCHRPTCSTFLPPSTNPATCPKCLTQTCIKCKNAYHGTNNCGEDLATQEILRLATTEGWQRCPSCKTMVDLAHGCNHITCRCRTEFCYVCAALWRTCSCAVWDERRLLERANVIVDRNLAAEGAPGAVPAAQRHVLVQRQVQILVDDHECGHDGWSRLDGCYECDECYDILPWFIWVCRQCDLLACSRCRYNRL